MKAAYIFSEDAFISMLKRHGVKEYTKRPFCLKIKFKEDSNPHLQDLSMPQPTVKEMIEKAKAEAMKGVTNEDILFDPYVGLPTR